MSRENEVAKLHKIIRKQAVEIDFLADVFNKKFSLKENLTKKNEPIYALTIGRYQN